MFSEQDGHPDPTGPEEPEEPTRAEDGNVIDHPSSKRSGASLAERAETEQEEEDGQQAFVVEDGTKVTLSSLVKRGTPVEVKYRMTGKAIPNSTGGLLDPHKTSHVVLADCVVDDVDIQYIRDGQGRVEKVIQYVTLKPRIVQNALSEAGTVMLQEAIKARQQQAA